jgi:predicted TIM-barrel fold metal-dependent hydrolase
MTTPIIDCQVHAYERDRPERPWVGTLAGPAEVTGNDMVAAMDAVGVDGALLVSPYSMYRFDAGYALEVRAQHPTRFGLIKPFDPHSPSVAEEMAQWAGHAGVVGARIMLAEADAAAEAGIGRILETGAELGLPVNLLAWDRPSALAKLATRHPNTRLVLDHLGLRQPFEPPPPAAPFASLDEVLALADHDNIAIKVSGACTLSHEPYPYPDIWAPLTSIFDAFGLERCIWGTDWTRAVALLTYEQGVRVFLETELLSEAECGLLMGGSLAKIYDWSPG